MRSDFSELSDDEIRGALYVGAAKLAARLLPRLKAMAPDLKQSQLESFEDECLRTLAKRHGVSELFELQEAE